MSRASVQPPSMQPGLAGARDAGIVLATRIITVLSALANQACLAWFLAPAGRGEFAVCMTFAAVIGVIFGLGFDRAIQYSVMAKRMELSEAIGLAFLTTLGNSLVAVAVASLIVKAPLEFFEKASVDSFRLSLFLIPLTSLYTAMSLLLVGVRRFKFAALEAVAFGLVNVALVALLTGFLQFGVAGAIVSVSVSYLVAALMQCAYLSQRIRLPSWKNARSVVGYAARYYIARLGNVVNVQIAVMVLAFLGSQSEIGLFAAASALVGRMLMLSDSIVTALQPRVGASKDGRPELVAQACRVSGLFVGACLLTLGAFAPVIVPILLSPAFYDAIPLVWILALGVWTAAVARPVSTFFIGTNRPGLVSATTAVECAGHVLLIAPLYYLYGLFGAAVGATLAQIVADLVRVAVFSAITGLPHLAIWLPTVDDASNIKQILINLYRKVTTPRSEAHGVLDQPQKQPARQTVMLNDRVVKHQSPERTRLEMLKTRSGAAVSKRCGLFLVPEVGAADETRGVIEFRRIHDAVTLWEFLRRENDDALTAGLLARVGHALAAIHRDLSLPDDCIRILPERWLCGVSDNFVCLHGDFNAFNVLTSRDGRMIYITDWATSDLVEPNGTIGPRFFDVAWFVSSLCVRTHVGTRRIQNVQPKARIFCDAYLSQCEGDVARYARDDFDDYFARFLQEFVKLTSRPWYAPFTRVRARLVSFHALQRLVSHP